MDKPVRQEEAQPLSPVATPAISTAIVVKPVQHALPPAVPTVTPPVFVPVVLQSPAKEQSQSWVAEATSFVEALSHLGLIIIVVTVIIVFRQELKNLLRKLKKGKFFGQEFEFQDDLKKLETKAEDLQEKAETIAETVAEAAPAAPVPVEPTPAPAENPAAPAEASPANPAPTETSEVSRPTILTEEANKEVWPKILQSKNIDLPQKTFEQMLARAWNDAKSTDPTTETTEGLYRHLLMKRVRQQNSIGRVSQPYSASSHSQMSLIVLAQEIERQLRRALARLGALKSGRSVSIKQGFNELARFGLMQDVIGSVELFNRIRSHIVHGDVQPTDSDLARALDSGNKILSTLLDWPAERHVVIATDILLYVDPELQKPRPNIKAIKIAEVLPSGRKTSTYVFPSPSEYKPGMEVSWEFDELSLVGHSYYIDPDSRVVENFTSSIEFIGRDIDSIM